MADRLFGDIPLIRESFTAADGTLHDWWRYDPDFNPLEQRARDVLERL